MCARVFVFVGVSCLLCQEHAERERGREREREKENEREREREARRQVQAEVEMFREVDWLEVGKTHKV